MSIRSNFDLNNKGKEDLFLENIFRFNYENIPIPKVDWNSKALIEASGTNAVLFTLMDYKAKKSGLIRPMIVKETSDKAAMKEYYIESKRAATHSDFLELKKLRTKAFEEIYFDDISDTDINGLGGLKKLLTRPNPFQTWSQFMYSNSFFKDNGWTAMYKWKPKINLGKTVRLYSLPTHLVNIISSGTWDDPIKAYQFDYNPSRQFEIKKEDIIRVSSFSPKYDTNGAHLYGTSKIKVAWDEFQTYAKAVEREYSSFTGGDLRAILMPDGDILDLPSDQKQQATWFQNFKDGIIRAFKQSGNQKIAITPTMLKDIQLRQELTEKITAEAKEKAQSIACAVWGLDMPAVFPTNQGTTFDNQKEYAAKTLRNGVFPDLRDFEEALREDLVKPEYKGYSLLFDYDVYEELTRDLAKEMEMLTKADFLSDNEKRAYIDYDEMEDERAAVPRAYWNDLNNLESGSLFEGEEEL